MLHWLRHTYSGFSKASATVAVVMKTQCWAILLQLTVWHAIGMVVAGSKGRDVSIRRLEAVGFDIVNRTATGYPIGIADGQLRVP